MTTPTATTTDTVRELTVRDANEFLRLRRESFLKAPLSFALSPDDPIDRASVEEQLRECGPENFVLGYFLGERLVGTFGLRRMPHVKRRHRAMIHTVYVSEQARGKGVARRLQRACIERARAIEGLDRLILSVSHHAAGALRLYRQAGFVEFGREPGAARTGSTPMDEIHMLLDL